MTGYEILNRLHNAEEAICEGDIHSVKIRDSLVQELADFVFHKWNVQEVSKVHGSGMGCADLELDKCVNVLKSYERKGFRF